MCTLCSAVPTLINDMNSVVIFTMPSRRKYRLQYKYTILHWIARAHSPGIALHAPHHYSHTPRNSVHYIVILFYLRAANISRFTRHQEFTLHVTLARNITPDLHSLLDSVIWNRPKLVSVKHFSLTVSLKTQILRRVFIFVNDVYRTL